MATIALFTDFGSHGPYVGLMQTVLANATPQTTVIDLMHDAPSRNPQAAAYLLAALVDSLPRDTILCAVVDPGVGSQRHAIAVQADQRWLIGPSNGLLEIAARRAANATFYRILLEPTGPCRSFHGRDLFAPSAARLANGQDLPLCALSTTLPGANWPDDLAEIIYVDTFGNAMTGYRARELKTTAVVQAGDVRLRHAGTFSDVQLGTAFWYGNSVGLVELAVNRGSAQTALNLTIGSSVVIRKQPRPARQQT